MKRDLRAARTETTKRSRVHRKIRRLYGVCCAHCMKGIPGRHGVSEKAKVTAKFEAITESAND